MTPEELAQQFRIPLEMLEMHGVRHCTDAEVCELLGVHGRRDQNLSGLDFPYRDPRDGRITGHRVRRDRPEVGSDGKAIDKYISDLGNRHFFIGPIPAEWLGDISIPIIFVESEKSALAIHALALRTGRKVISIAIGGCWGWRRTNGKEELPEGGSKRTTGPGPDFDLVTWAGRRAIVLFDSNVATSLEVQCARAKLSEHLLSLGTKVFHALVPVIPGINGPDDFIAKSTDEEAVRMLNSLEPFDASLNGNNPQKSRQVEGQTPRGGSAATLLIEVALKGSELFHFGEYCFATLVVGDHRETYPLRSRGFKSWLNKEFFEREGRAPDGKAVNSALDTLEGFARYKSDEYPTFVRIAESEGKIYVDLCDEHWRVVEVRPTGWRVIASADCPVRFRRAHGMLALPEPQRAGNISQLREFLNVESEVDFILLVAWLIASFSPKGPYPVLILHGEQGSAKSTTARVLRNLVDPNTAPLRCEPREARDLMIAANNGWIVALDNLSRIPDWLSDALCRLATGGGFGTRTLYTDDDEKIFDAKRPVILNGIEELASRGDLLDRAVLVYLPRIDEQQRRDEKSFTLAFELARPKILGALLDAVVAAIANVDSVQLSKLPRLADAALWITAAEPALGWKRGQFLAAYDQSRRVTNELPLETPVAETIRRLRLPYVGTSTELLEELERTVDDRTRRMRTWPSSGRSLSDRLRRLAPNLRQAGIAVEFCRESHSGKRLISLSPTAGNSSSPSSPASTNAAIGDGGDDGDDEKQSFSLSVPQEGVAADANDAWRFNGHH